MKSKPSIPARVLSRGRGLALGMAVLLLLVSLRASACGPGPLVAPDDFDLYRILPYYAELQEPADGRREANCRAWQRSLGGTVPLETIRQAVYDLSLRDWLLVQQGDDRGNAFCHRLLATRDTAAIQLLLWSKYYEAWSLQMRSPWYYGCGLDDCSFDLDSVLAASTHYIEKKNRKYRDRYLLLALKCLYRSGRGEEGIALWRKHKGLLRGSHLHDQAEGYYAACLNRMGHRREALDVYSRLGDAASLQLLLDDKVEVFERVLRHRPNSPFFPMALQRVLFVAENYTTSSDFTPYSLDSLQLRRLLTLCRLAGSDVRVKNKPMWRYAAACLLDLQGRRREALALVENLRSDDDFLNTSIRVLRLHLHARLDPVDDAYEQRLLRDLRWLDARMQQEWASADSATRFRLSHIDGFGYNYTVFRTVYSYDALRRIVLGEGGLYDRFRRAGRTTRALQLANMADNRFLQLSANPIVPLCRAGGGVPLYETELLDAPYYGDAYSYFPVWTTDTLAFPAVWQRGRFYPDSEYDRTAAGNQHFNAHDYSNILFIRADRLKADELAAYWQRVEHPRSSADRWLNARGYTDADYWRDIVGTHLLRERRFAEAERWLAKVDPGYQHRLNTEPWMLHDPFSHDASPLPSHDGYKLRFARIMADMDSVRSNPHADPNDRADAMLTLSIGLRNAFGYLCWPLVAYGYGCFYSWDEKLSYYDYPLHDFPYYRPYMLADYAAAPYAERAEKQASQLRKKAFATYTDPDRKAQALKRVHEYTYLMRHFAHTPTGQDIARRCDQWRDYLEPKASELS